MTESNQKERAEKFDAVAQTVNQQTMQKRLVQRAFQQAYTVNAQRLFSVNKFALAEEKAVFDWKDPLCLESLLSDEEKSIRDQV